MASASAKGDAHPSVGRRVDHRARPPRASTTRTRRRTKAGQPLDIVHRDVSPQNILLSFEGAVKIADFGIASARLFAEEQGVLKGKFGYMSPGAGARREGRPPQRPLRARRHPLGDPRRAPAPRRARGRSAARHRALGHRRAADDLYAADVPPELEAIALRALARSAGRTLPDRARARPRRSAARSSSKQELIDASTLEHDDRAARLARGRSRVRERAASLAGRGSRALRSDDARTQAAVPRARSSRRSQRRASLAAAAARPEARGSSARPTPSPGATAPDRARARSGTSRW